MKQEINLKRSREKSLLKTIFVFSIIIFSICILQIILISADPSGPTNIESVWNETMTSTTAGMFNISGGYIGAINLSANAQNTHWKAFVGWVNGGFTLDDASGSTIYDWSGAVSSGRVYATRDSSTIEWNLIQCANLATSLSAEDAALFHNFSARPDTINKTFQFPGTHSGFNVAGRPIGPNTCPTLNRFVNDAAQDVYFQEVALYDSTSIIYATILEDNRVGYDGQSYDFQMLVPENGSAGFTGATAYYLYVELE